MTDKITHKDTKVTQMNLNFEAWVVMDNQGNYCTGKGHRTTKLIPQVLYASKAAANIAAHVVAKDVWRHYNNASISAYCSQLLTTYPAIYILQVVKLTATLNGFTTGKAVQFTKADGVVKKVTVPSKAINAQEST